MTHCRPLFALCLAGLCAAVLATGCTTPQNPMIRHAIWNEPPEAKIFNAAIKALHTQEYMILEATPETGLIVTDWASFQGPGQMIASYRLNVLVFESAGDTTTVSVKIAVKASIQPTDAEKVAINNRIGTRIQSFYVEMARLLGEPTTVGHGMLSW